MFCAIVFNIFFGQFDDRDKCWWSSVLLAILRDFSCASTHITRLGSVNMLLAIVIENYVSPEAAHLHVDVDVMLI